jgi:SAM-dependent methyltransferase
MVDQPLSRTLAAAAWAELQPELDLQLSPLGLQAIAALAPSPGETILDIGCGTGQTVLQLADRVGQSGQVIGVDMASTLLESAQKRAHQTPQASFITADAATLDRPHHTVDACFSRFGVMAFAEPIAAFANLHRLLKPAGRLAFVCWRSLAENELDNLPLRAAGLEHLADATPFTLADPATIHTTLTQAGFHTIAIAPHDQHVTAGDIETTLRVLLRIGPLGRILREHPTLRPAAEPKVRAALASQSDPSRVTLRAATWIVTATAGIP